MSFTTFKKMKIAANPKMAFTGVGILSTDGKEVCPDGVPCVCHHGNVAAGAGVKPLAFKQFWYAVFTACELVKVSNGSTIVSTNTYPVCVAQSFSVCDANVPGAYKLIQNIFYKSKIFFNSKFSLLKSGAVFYSKFVFDTLYKDTDTAVSYNACISVIAIFDS